MSGAVVSFIEDALSSSMMEGFDWGNPRSVANWR